MKWGGRFSNPNINDLKRSLLDIILWQLGYYNDERPPKRAPQSFSYPNPQHKVSRSTPQVTWINHCTFLINVEGIHLLTDPIWSERCSPVPFLGPKRRHEPPLPLKNLPPIDLVLISHDHYDHLDKRTVLHLHRQNPIITWVVPLGVKRWFQKQGINEVIELNWWEESELSIRGQKVAITAVPTQHFSGRGLLDKNRTLWAGFVVDFACPRKKKKRLYFVGDTGYNKKDFKKIGEAFGEMTVGLS